MRSEKSTKGLEALGEEINATQAVVGKAPASRSSPAMQPAQETANRIRATKGIQDAVVFRGYVPEALCSILDNIWKYIPYCYADIRGVDDNTRKLEVLAHKICKEPKGDFVPSDHASFDASDKTSPPVPKEMEEAKPYWSRLGSRRLTFDKGITGRAALTGEQYYVPNTKAIPEDPYYDEYRTETRSAIATPVRLLDRKLGVLLLESDYPNFFDDKNQHNWLKEIAIHIAAVLQRRFDEKVEGAWEQRYKALDSINQQIADSKSLDKLLQDLAHNIREGIDGCDLCRILIFDKANDCLHIMVPSNSENPEPDNNRRILASGSVEGDVVHNGEASFIPSLEGEKRFSMKDWARENGYQAAMFLPLPDPDNNGERLGCIVLYTQSLDFTQLKRNEDRAKTIARTVANTFNRLRKNLPNSAFQETFKKYSENPGDGNRALRDVLDIAREKTGARLGSIFLARNGRLTLEVSTGIHNVREDNYKSVSYEITEEASRKHRTVYVAYECKALRLLPPSSQLPAKFGEPLYYEAHDDPPLERGFLAAPIKARNPNTSEEELLGVIRIVHKEGGLAFTPVDEDILDKIGDAVGVGMMNANLVAQRQNIMTLIGKHNLLIPVVVARDNAASLLEASKKTDSKRLHEVAAKLQVICDALEQTQGGIEILAALTEIQNEGYDTIRPEKDTVDLCYSLEGILSLLEEHARQKRIEFDRNFPNAQTEKRPVIRADKKWLDRAIFEMINNAVKHACSGTQIRIDLRCDRSFWEISVENIGPDSLPDARRNLWKPGLRKADSNGYGLADMRIIIEKHRGEAPDAEVEPLSDAEAERLKSSEPLALWHFRLRLPTAVPIT